MNKKDIAATAIKAQGLLPLFYHDDVTICIAVAKALYDAGVTTIEFTNRGVNALKNFEALIKERDAKMPQLLLGIGTITSNKEAADFIALGADFLISPFFDDEVCAVAIEHNILWIPGCMTPTEIHTAKKAGCTLIKLFPGNALGAGFAEAVLPLFKGLDFVVTGGVEANEQSISQWFKAGVVGVGMGSKLITKEILATSNFEQLKNSTANVLNIINTVKI
ncbi:hypothetical protein [Flavobacterium rivuli]|nr:hypothetical protein [Flavobacterium rivuli]